MKQAFLVDYENRRRQVRHYLSVVVGAERVASLGAATVAQERRLLTLRAGTFLVLYNLIEASTRGALEAIHDQITTEQVPFGLLSNEIRREVVRRFKNHADAAVHYAIDDLPVGFVMVALSQGVRLSGNVDAKQIREFGASYGFSCETIKDQTWGGSDLYLIQELRNQLAHGRQTFEEVGRNYPAPDLVKIARRSTAFMSQIQANVALYLDQKRYRADAAAT